jgi:bifunctional non-homologous end joining protein LigD
VVIGFSLGEGRRKGYFGLPLLAVNDHGKLRFVGHTGSGFDTVTLIQLHEKLKELQMPKPPSKSIFHSFQSINREPIWISPDLVAEIKFREWTKDGIMRIPIFVRLRKDKLSSDCIIEKEKDVSELESSVRSSSSMPSSVYES